MLRGAFMKRFDNDEKYKDVIKRDLVQCDVCGEVIWVYIFKNGEYRTIHKHNGVEYVPKNYVPLQTEENGE